MKEHIDNIRDRVLSLIGPFEQRMVVLPSDVSRVFEDTDWIPQYVKQLSLSQNVGLVNRVAQSPLNIHQFGLYGVLHSWKGHPYYSVAAHESPLPYYFDPAITKSSSVGLNPDLIKAGLGTHDLKKRVFTHVADQDPVIRKLGLDHHTSLYRALESPEIASAVQKEFGIDTSELRRLGDNDPNKVAFNQLEDFALAISEGPVCGIAATEGQKRTLPSKVEIAEDGTVSIKGRFVFYVKHEHFDNYAKKYVGTGSALQYVGTFLRQLTWSDYRKENVRFSALESLVLRHLRSIMDENKFQEMMDSPEGEKALYRKARELKDVDRSYPIQCLVFYLDNPSLAVSHLPMAVWGCAVAPYGERTDLIEAFSKEETKQDMKRITEEMFNIPIVASGHFSVIPGCGREINHRGKVIERYPTVTVVVPALFTIPGEANKRNPGLVSKIREKGISYYRDFIIPLDETFIRHFSYLREFFNMSHGHHSRELYKLKEEERSRKQERSRPRFISEPYAPNIPASSYYIRDKRGVLSTVLSTYEVSTPQPPNIRRDKHGRIIGRGGWKDKRKKS